MLSLPVVLDIVMYVPEIGFLGTTSVNFDNPTKRKYAAERYQMFLWIFDKFFRENAKNRHFLAQNVQIDNDFW